ncbi:MAG: hypothetical protein ACYCX2_02115 [Christensenellales bacterium]
MPDYKEMYFQLTGRVAEIIELLIYAQQEGEEEYIDNNEPFEELKQIKRQGESKQNRYFRR